jgi:hypothetical protein
VPFTHDGDSYSGAVLEQQIAWHEREAEEKMRRASVLKGEAERHMESADRLLRQLEQLKTARQRFVEATEPYNCEGTAPCQ